MTVYVVLCRTSSETPYTCIRVTRLNCLTHLRLASLLWDIGKQNSPRCDAAERGVPSGAILFAYRIFIEKLNKFTPDAPKNESGLTQMIMMGKSICQIWVKQP